MYFLCLSMLGGTICCLIGRLFLMAPRVVHRLNQKTGSPILRLDLLVKYPPPHRGRLTSCGALLAVQCPLGSSSLDITPLAPNSTQMKKKILMVEDNPDLNRMLQFLLQNSYYTIPTMNGKLTCGSQVVP